MASIKSLRTKQRLKSSSISRKLSREVFEVRDLREREFFTVDNQYLDGKWLKLLKGCPSAVYFALCRHADRGQQAFPSMDYLSDETGYGRRHVRRSIKALEAHRLIQVNREHRDHNIYLLLNRKHWVKLKIIKWYQYENCRPAEKRIDKASDNVG